ncbi:MAG: geranylgeranylglyceryl/heptaprenylglyceryl phosphate synthase [archaeon]
MIPGKIENYLNKRKAEEGCLFFGVIDPVDHLSIESAVKAAVQTYKDGADAIVVGGSIGAQGFILNRTIKGIKEQTDAPVILFPGNIATISPYADAIYFMSMYNSRNPYWIFGAQLMAAPVIESMKLESIPTAYLMVEPGGTAGWVADCKLIPRDKPNFAAYSALAADLMGSRFVITDVGSAAPAPVPAKIVEAVRKSISGFYIVAGGIRSPKQVKDIVCAGADAIHVGTAIEKKGSVSNLIRACKSEAKKRL